MESKRYSYFRLDLDFMNDYRIAKLSMSISSCAALVFYLQLIALSLDTCGVLNLDRYPVKTAYALAIATDTPRLMAWTAVKKPTKLGLIKVQDDGSVLLPGIAERIGSETYAAARMRRMRKRNALNLSEQENEAC